MDKSMFYLCLALSLSWLFFFVYVFFLDRQLRNLKRRLQARERNNK